MDSKSSHGAPREEATIVGLSAKVDSTPLGEEDLFDLLTFVSPLSYKWRELGIAVGLHQSTLDFIYHQNKDDINNCLRAVLLQWLKRNYSYQRFGVPSWKKLVQAVCYETGGVHRCKLVTEIAKKHPRPGTVVTLQTDGIQSIYNRGAPLHLMKYEWFHGMLCRNEAEKELRSFNERNSFLVRESEHLRLDDALSLSVIKGERVLHYKIKSGISCGYKIEGPHGKLLPSVPELISYYQDSSNWTTGRDLKLGVPCPRFQNRTKCLQVNTNLRGAVSMESLVDIDHSRPSMAKTHSTQSSENVDLSWRAPHSMLSPHGPLQSSVSCSLPELRENVAQMETTAIMKRLDVSTKRQCHVTDQVSMRRTKDPKPSIHPSRRNGVYLRECAYDTCKELHKLPGIKLKQADVLAPINTKRQPHVLSNTTTTHEQSSRDTTGHLKPLIPLKPSSLSSGKANLVCQPNRKTNQLHSPANDTVPNMRNNVLTHSRQVSAVTCTKRNLPPMHLKTVTHMHANPGHTTCQTKPPGLITNGSVSLVKVTVQRDINFVKPHLLAPIYNTSKVSNLIHYFEQVPC